MNKTHNTAVHGTPEDAAKPNTVTHVLNEQDNAQKFAHNAEVYEERGKALETL